MAESGSETEIKGVKEALGAGQQLLHKLYSELDKERECSATAASEALSMILRLQEEKAAMKMEASQYQRMTEEKIFLVEDCLASFEEIIHQKEMEIASLEFQVQAYRYKLLSMGCSDSGPCETKFADNLLPHKKDSAPNGEIGVSGGNLRRIKSLPLTQLDESYYRRNTAERETYEILKPDCCPNIPNIVERPNHCPWEQIKLLDEQVKEISDSKGCGEDRSETLNGGMVVFPWHTEASIQDKPDPDELRGAKPDANPKYSPSSSVQDIFEIPEAYPNLKACETRNRLQKKKTYEDGSRIGKPDSVSKEPSEQQLKDERAKARKASSFKSQKNKSFKSRKGKAVDSSTTPARQFINEIVAQSQPFQQLCHILDQIERSSNTKQEINEAAGVGERELLKEIQGQLNSIQSEMRSLKTKQPPSQDNTMYDLLQEAMLYFWF